MATTSMVASRARAGVDDSLVWLIEQLWERPEQRPAVRVSTDGTVPAGYRPLERYAVVPSLARTRFLIPLATRRAAWASTARYNALRPTRVRLARSAIGAGMRLGLAQRALRDRVVVCVRERMDADGLTRLLPSAHLAEVLGEQVVMGVGIGGQGPNRKPTLQLFARDGAAIGYAKVGWNELTRQLVRNEASALRARGARPLATVTVPELLAAGGWNGLELAVAAPLPPGVRRHRPPERRPPLEATREIAALGGLQTLPLAESPYWVRTRELAARAGGGPDADLTSALERYQEFVQRHWADTTLTFGSWHGDWVPWNLAWKDGRLFAWDWEHSGDVVPLGFDLLHWHFWVAFALERRGPVEAAGRSLTGGMPWLRDLGVSEPAARATAALYLLEVLLRCWRMQAEGAGWNPRFYPAILRALKVHADD
jgi:hypothetical protein